jgi:cell division protein FtsQ
VIRASKNRRRIDAEIKTARRRQALLHVVKVCARTALTIAIAGGLLVGGWRSYQWANSSPYFGLKRIEFRGLHHASDVELAKVANLSLGQNLFQLDTKLAERAMQTHPWVRSAAITRFFPDRLQATIVEHRPVAMVSLGTVYLLSAEGQPFKKVQWGDSVDLPLVTGIEREEYVREPEQVISRLRQALDVARAYKGPLSEIRLGRAGITLITDGGQEIRLGEGDAEEKLARLRRVRSELEKRGLTAEVIRLDNRARPGWITLKLAEIGNESLKSMDTLGR